MCLFGWLPVDGVSVCLFVCCVFVCLMLFVVCCLLFVCGLSFLCVCLLLVVVRCSVVVYVFACAFDCVFV